MATLKTGGAYYTQVRIISETLQNVLSRFVAFTPFYYSLLFLICTVTAVANFLTV